MAPNQDLPGDPPEVDNDLPDPDEPGINEEERAQRRAAREARKAQREAERDAAKAQRQQDKDKDRGCPASANTRHATSDSRPSAKSCA